MNTDDTLFIVNSPFQCLCMLEAINYYSIKNFDVILRPDNIELNNEMVKRILNEKGITYRICRMHPVFDIIPLIFNFKRKHYSKLFNGDYYFGGIFAYDYSLISSNKGAEIYYFDDGVETLRLFSNPPMKREVGPKYWIIHFICGIFKYIRHIGKPHYFTIFNLKSNKFLIEKNTLSTLKLNTKNREHKGVYIIGTNFDGIDIDKIDYFNLLKQLVSFCKNNYKEETIWYCPHRRNLDNEEMMSLLSDLGVSIFNTQITVEYDFVQRGINPQYIAGFGSTALYTLKTLYPDIRVDNVVMRLRKTTSVLNAYDKLFEEQCNEIGIGSVNFYDS